MTDLATKNDADEPSTQPQDVAIAQWAPAEPAPRKRRLWLWIGVPAALVAGGAVTASLLLIAPGTSVAGVPVGFMTPGAATDAIQKHLAETTVLIGDGGTAVSAADIEAGVDAAGLAAAAFEQRPMWNLPQWFGEPVAAEVELDPVVAADVLAAAAPELYTAPTDAAVSFDGAQYVVTPAVAGTGLDLAVVDDALQEAFASGRSQVTVAPTSVPVEAKITTAAAQAAADKANGMLGSVGFYVGDERTVPVDAPTAASWLTIAPGADGAFAVTADPAKIQASVDGLAGQVNRTPANGTVVVNSAGTTLETVLPGHDGRVLGDTSGVAAAFAKQLATGDSAYRLPVEVTPAQFTKLERHIDVDLSAQRVYMYENGAVVDSWSVSSGRPGVAQTETGNFTINYHRRSQTMSGSAMEDPNRTYSLDNVEWVMYFNGDQAFHGVYWNSDYLSGTPTSNGCVGMSNERARQLYEFAPQGTEVHIYGSTS